MPLLAESGLRYIIRCICAYAKGVHIMPVVGQIYAWPFFDDGITTSGSMYVGSFRTLSINQRMFIFGKASMFNGDLCSIQTC